MAVLFALIAAVVIATIGWVVLGIREAKSVLPGGGGRPEEPPTEEEME